MKGHLKSHGILVRERVRIIIMMCVCEREKS